MSSRSCVGDLCNLLRERSRGGTRLAGSTVELRRPECISGATIASRPAKHAGSSPRSRGPGPRSRHSRAASALPPVRSAHPMDPIGSVGRGWLMGASVRWCRGQVAGTSTPMSHQAGAGAWVSISVSPTGATARRSVSDAGESGSAVRQGKRERPTRPRGSHRGRRDRPHPRSPSLVEWLLADTRRPAGALRGRAPFAHAARGSGRCCPGTPPRPSLSTNAPTPSRIALSSAIFSCGLVAMSISPRTVRPGASPWLVVDDFGLGVARRAARGRLLGRSRGVQAKSSHPPCKTNACPVSVIAGTRVPSREDGNDVYAPGNHGPSAAYRAEARAARSAGGRGANAAC